VVTRSFPYPASFHSRGGGLAGGWGPLTDSQRRDLLEILEDRYGRHSTVVTSQLPVATWHDAIGDATLADAVLDRLVYNAYELKLKGESNRKNQAPVPPPNEPS
jgi:DNA replication protein DnaC